MNKIELAKRIRETALLAGDFVLRSGKISSFYFDKYRFEGDPEILQAVAGEMQKLLPPDFDRLAGLELGGIPLAAGLSLITGKPCLYVRKTAKSYGTANLVEGGFQPGETVVVIEDVITTAGQAIISIQQMRELGLVVNQVICAIDREEGGKEKLEEIGCSLASVLTGKEIGMFQ